MKTTTAGLHSLSFSQSKTYLAAAAMVAGNILLPAIFHSIPRGGLIFLPIYFFTLLGAYKYGFKAGLLIAVFSPVVNHLLTGMPPAGSPPSILIKSVLLAFAAAYAAKRTGRATIPALAAVVITYQIAGTGAEWIMKGSLYAAAQDFRLAVPGMLLQVFGVYGILRLVARYGY